MTALMQHFAVPADNDLAVTLKIDASLIEAVDGGMIYWRVYEQSFGVQTQPPIIVIEKSSADGSIRVSSPPQSCAVQLDRGDTADLLRNYYHEGTLVDAAGNISTFNYGIMTVTETSNREASP